MAKNRETSPGQLGLFEKQEYNGYPKQPYRFGSGAIYQDESLERLMFYRYSHIKNLKHNQEKGKMHQKLKPHFEALIKSGDNRVATQDCPYCKKRKVEWFALRRISNAMTCCSNPACQKQLKLEFNDSESVTLMPIKFSSLDSLDTSILKSVISRVLKPVFGLPKRINDDVAYNFFAR